MREVRRVVLEALLIAAGSLTLAFGANAVSQAGLYIWRDYFDTSIRPPEGGGALTGPTTRPRPGGSGPVDTTGSQPAQHATDPAPEPSKGPQPAPASEAEERLAEYGIGAAHVDDVKALMADPMYNTTRFLIDARNEAQYREGHLPGSFHLDHYRADRYLPDLLPLLFPAEEIILYCGGGECQDSELAAIDLINSGIPREKIFVYVDGYREWVSRGELVEKGERGSGNLAPGQLR